VAKYRILTCDGGGIRGILTARLLERLVQKRPNLLSQVDLFAGTSTGSFIAIGLAKGLTPTQLVNVYQEQGPRIFHRDVLHELGSLWGFRRARYQTQPRFDGLHPSIGDITLDELLPKHVLVSSFQLDWNNGEDSHPKKPPHTWKAKFWHNYEGPDSDGAEKAIEVIMRSSAAPTYFPIYEGYVDGGVVANNPSLCALAQAINQQTGGKQDIKDVVLMSVGTGAKMTSITSRDGDWGIEEWGFSLLDLIFESGSGLADYQCQQLLGECYARLNPDLGESIGLDAVGQIKTLIAKANDYDLGPALDLIDGQWQ
jgi:uncharacterized protein